MPTTGFFGSLRLAAKPRRGRRSAGNLAVIASLAIAVVVGAAPASSEETNPADGQESLTTPQAIAPAMLTIETPADDSFIPRNKVAVSGQKTPGSTVTVLVNGATACASAAVATPSGEWQCDAAVPNGPDVALIAIESLDEIQTQASISLNVLGRPTIGGASKQLTTGVIFGSAYPGAGITLTVGGTTQSCVAATADGYWSCNIASPSGQYGVTARQSSAEIGAGLSDPSQTTTVRVDKDQPRAPQISSPRANSRILTQPVKVTGIGENEGRVDVYVDGVPRCSTTVVGSSWSCTTTGFARGDNTIQAVLRDAAGNYAKGNSAPIRVAFGPAPVKPAPKPHHSDAPQTTPSHAPDIKEIPWYDTPIFPGPDGQGPTVIEALTNWGTPTDFGSQLSSPAETSADRGWLWAALLALIFIGLIALPIRLLASSVRGRVRMTRPALTGRNQPHSMDEGDTEVNPWLLGIVPLATASTLVLLAEGPGGEVRYLRLLLAVGAGLAILNIVAAALVPKLTSRWQGVSGRLRFLPILLIMAAIVAALSRLIGVEPPLVAGVLIVTGFTLTIPARQRAIVNLAQVGATTLLAVIAWSAHAWLGPVVGFWPSVLSEILATVCLAGIGSALVLTVPLGRLPGRVLFEWSVPVWLGTALVVATLAAAISLSAADTRLAILISLPVIAGFAAACVAIRAWIRYSDAANLHR